MNKLYIKFKNTRKKGQMFLITAIILITTLVILAANIKISKPAIDRVYIETSIENKIFENIKEEIAKISLYAFYEDLHENVLDFLKFVRNYAIAKGFTFNGIYLGITHNKTDFINISFINSFGKAINLTLILNSTPEQIESFIVQDNEIYNTTFNITSGENYTIRIVFNEYEENIIIYTDDIKSSYTYFFDIKMTTPLGTRREKYANRIYRSY